jgi:hypothetical protein
MTKTAPSHLGSFTIGILQLSSTKDDKGKILPDAAGGQA